MNVFIMTPKDKQVESKSPDYILSGTMVNGEVSGIAIERSPDGDYEKYYIYRNVVFPNTEKGTHLTEDQKRSFFERFAGENLAKSAHRHLDEYVFHDPEADTYFFTEEKEGLFPPFIYRSSEEIIPVSLKYHFWDTGYGVPSVPNADLKTMGDIERHFA